MSCSFIEYEVSDIEERVINSDSSSLSFQLSSGETYCVLCHGSVDSSCSQTCAVSSEITPMKYNLESPKNKFV